MVRIKPDLRIFTRENIEMDYHDKVIAPGDRFSKRAGEICRASWNNSPAITIVSGGAGMRAMHGYRWNEAAMNSKIYMVPQSDGAGGKPQFFALMNTPQAFKNLGWEVITMNADDIACRGGLPVVMTSSNIDVKQITDENWHLCEALLMGFGEALAKSNLVLMTGETAVMKDSITAFCDTGTKDQLILNWSATCEGLAAVGRPPNGSTIKPSMAIVGLRDSGYRCNGGTLLANIIVKEWGDDLSIMDIPEAAQFVERVVAPSRSYAKTIARLNGWQPDGTMTTPPVRLHGAAHITGGGVWEKLGEILPEGVGANLDEMPTPAEILLEAQFRAQSLGMPISDYRCYGNFHGGCGAMVICDPQDTAVVMKEMENDGHEPYLVGETVASDQKEIIIQSRFMDCRELSSLRPE
jgi:phosphoribosylformylglycinamidine cyclo-ligase